MKNEKEAERESLFWADQAASQVIAEHGEKKVYTCASGTSPSGIIHFGNFREAITTDIVARALRDKGKKVRFIFSFDDYDRFRKVPANIPQEFEKCIRMPYSAMPDPFGCHRSYAEHFEKAYEAELKLVGVEPEFIRQAEKYMKCAYAEQIKFALNNKEKIRNILDKYKSEPSSADWYPLEIFCEKCKKDDGYIIEYDGNYTIKYKCECGFSDTVDFRKKGIVKLPWRVDWPMRWAYEDVNFEPGGKEHSTVGGSITTSKEIVEQVWGKKAPTYKKYEFVLIKGAGGKMSGSKGNVITISEALEIYEPEIIRFMFAGIRPDAEFAVSFDLDVLKVYEDFDTCERIYYGKQPAKDDKEKNNNKRIYEMSVMQPNKEMLIQPGFRHLTTILQICENDFNKVKEYFKKELKAKQDTEKLKTRAKCAWNWLQKYAPEDMKFSVQQNIPSNLSETEKSVARILAKTLAEKKWNEEELSKRIYELSEELGLKPQEFFKAAYRVLLNKEKGPRLAPFLLMLGDRATRLFEQV